MDVGALLATGHAPQPTTPRHHSDDDCQPDPVSSVRAARVEVIGQRISRQYPENPDPDGSMKDPVVALVACAENGLLHTYFSRIAGAVRVRNAASGVTTTCRRRTPVYRPPAGLLP